MGLPFKYISKFSSYVSASTEDTEELLSNASLDSLRDIIPEDIDFEKNIDLVGVAFNAAVANRFNKNGDGIDSATAIAIKDYFIHKPTNIEHQRDKVVGHVVGASISSFGDNASIGQEEAQLSRGPFNISLSAVLYKSVNPGFADLVQQSVDEDSEFYQKVSASWEIGFNSYKIALGSCDMRDAEIIEDESRAEELRQYLKAYGGTGKTEDGIEVHRLIVGDIYPLGIGFTANPAAEVKGLTVDEKSESQFRLKSREDGALEKIEIKNLSPKEKSSHSNKDDVNFNKDSTPRKIMEQEILQQVTETLEAQASSKRLSEEAIANITRVFHDAIMEKNDQWKADKESLVKEKEELIEADKTAQEEIEGLKAQLAETATEIETLKTDDRARKALEKFNDRMSQLDDEFELEDEDRIVLASDLKNLDTSDEAYAEYKEKLAVMWKQKTKAFIEEQQKALESKIEEEVQKRISELSQTEATDSDTEEVVEEAIDNAEVEEDTVANNNGGSTEESLSLREKFKKAFSKENVTIQY